MLITVNVVSFAIKRIVDVLIRDSILWRNIALRDYLMEMTFGKKVLLVIGNGECTWINIWRTNKIHSYKNGLGVNNLSLVKLSCFSQIQIPRWKKNAMLRNIKCHLNMMKMKMITLIQASIYLICQINMNWEEEFKINKILGMIPLVIISSLRNTDGDMIDGPQSITRLLNSIFFLRMECILFTLTSLKRTHSLKSCMEMTYLIKFMKGR